MKKVYFAQAQYLRKKEFVVLTQLTEDGKQKYISKEAIYPEGKEHIKNVFDNYKLLEKSKNNFQLPKTKLVDNKLIIEYIDNPNLAAEIETCLIEGDIENATKKFQETLDFFESIPTVKTDPYKSSGFTKFFDPKKQYYTKQDVECWYPGFHDTNFDNFIRKNDNYYFVDFEWCFDFPLPKNFLLLRSVFYLGLKLNRILQTMASRDFPCFNFYHDILVPVDWLDRIDHSVNDLQKMIDYEYNLLKDIYSDYPTLDPIKTDYISKKITVPVKVAGSKISRLKNQVQTLQEQKRLLQSQFDSSSQHATNLERIVKAKDKDIKNLHQHIDELREVNDKYQKQSYKTLEKLEETSLARSKTLRVLLRKMSSLLIRTDRLFRKG